MLLSVSNMLSRCCWFVSIKVSYTYHWVSVLHSFLNDALFLAFHAQWYLALHSYVFFDQLILVVVLLQNYFRSLDNRV